MKIRTFLIILSVLISTLSIAQSAPSVNVQVKGQVVDSLTNEAISYATIKVMAKSSPVLLKAVAADDNGKFQFPMNKMGEYILSIEYIGKNAVKKDIVIGDQKVMDLGKILMTEKTLSEVVITAQKPLVQVDLDKIVYSMESDPDAKTNNVLEMLKKVPMITVDGDENIQLKGSTSFKIYMNGKPSNMISKNPKEILRGMPANTVKDIQVITDPGAKYDAEGVTGIINIITQSNSSMGGYTATLNGGVRDRGGFGGYDGGAYLSMKYGKIGFTGSYNYYDWRQPEGNNTSYSEDLRNTDYAKDNRYEYRNGTSKNRGNGQYGSGELSFEIDTLNLINVGFNRYYGTSKGRTGSSTEMFREDHTTTTYKYDQLGNTKGNYGGTDINMDYQRTFKKKDQLFTASYRLSLNPDDSESNSDIDVHLGVPPSYVKTNKQFSDAEMKEHTFQADFVTPFGKIHSLEAGLKYIIRLNESTSGYDIWDGSDWVNVLRPTSDRFKHEQDILSAYGGYNAKFKKWGVKAGLRYEATWLDARFPIKPDANFKTDYGNLVPSATVTYQIKPAQTIRFGYNMRISRPGIWQLNPNEDSSNPSNIRQGNPNLDAVKSHSLNTNYSFFNPKLNFNLNLSYNFQNNGIEDISTFVNNIKYTTYENVGKGSNLGLSGYVNWSPNQKIRLYSNLSGRYTDIKSNISGERNHGFSGNLWGGAQYSFPKSLKFYLNVGGSTPYISLQNEGSSYFFHSVSASKGFMSDKLNFRIYAQNPLKKNNEWKSKTWSPEFFSESIFTSQMRGFGISVSYRFGEMKQQIKKAKRGISNDDSMGGGQGSQGGGQGGQGGGQN
ncbi:MAG: TonB-dependent receptor [Prevotella sp.]|jgi:outer membrane receptor protein involved in Fe transport|nr:TonB-dependent receptor [Prevotella sp.]